jgi:hypothetical protein
MDKATLLGALRSKTVWWNVLLALLASLEMFSASLTTLFGAKTSASILMTGAMANLVLRTVTTQALREKS